MKTIRTNDLKIILDRMIEHLLVDKNYELKFEDDFYWEVDNDTMTNMSEEPKIVVGSLSDDIGFLNSLVVEDYQTNYLELNRLASLFRFMALKLQ